MSYTIGELAKELGVNEHTLRYYEKEGLIKTTRVNNIRKYSETDKDWLALILHLKNSGMSICELKEFAKGDIENINVLHSRISCLEKQKGSIRQERQRLLSYYESISRKLDEYEEKLFLKQQVNK